MAMKLNMAKAYDRVEWHFLKVVMEKMGFSAVWIGWIMSCISTVIYSFNINGQPKEYIKLNRGLRQGDPLSPYWFLIFFKGISNLLEKAVEMKEISGLKINRHRLALTHLFFADDTLVLCKASKNEAYKLKDILYQCEKDSGQLINLKKSSILFSKNTKTRLKESICIALGGIQPVSQGK